MVDALGNPIDGKGDIGSKLTSPVEKVAPGGNVSESQLISQVQNRLKAVDSMVPIGRGPKRIDFSGDRQTGKTGYRH